MTFPTPGIYGWVTLLGILVGAFLWHRRWKTSDPTLFGIFVGGLIGAFLGAKLVYFLAEGWTRIGQPGFWIELGYGKTILGALLGGYGGVEFTKWLIGYRKPTGDWFALAVPIGIAFGRVGCLQHGCCLGQAMNKTWYTLNGPTGISRWPVAPVEILFNLMAVAMLFQLRKFAWTRGQLFHLYLIGYAVFRFLHEFLRDTPRILWDRITGYQVAALALLALAIWRFYVRKQPK